MFVYVLTLFEFFLIGGYFDSNAKKFKSYRNNQDNF